ncbi:MAG TPA: hypothetical protein VFA70_05765 [Dehalococcoidia bacterium]|nr:hypothetical protein [Dehalococcoidia bacterium]
MAQGQEFRATANFTYSATTKLDIAQIAAGNAAGKPGVTLRGLIVTSNLTTATPQRVQLGYCANANKATSMTANTPVATRQNAASVIAPQSTVTTWASGQTDATSVSWWRDEYADLRAGAGWYVLDIPESRPDVPETGCLVVAFGDGAGPGGSPKISVTLIFTEE